MQSHSRFIRSAQSLILAIVCLLPACAKKQPQSTYRILQDGERGSVIKIFKEPDTAGSNVIQQ
jgi:hypothetical protein